MFSGAKMGAFIAARRRMLGATQQKMADALGVTFQAVSKWETGQSSPDTALLSDLAHFLGVTADELLNGEERPESAFTYRRAGVDISYTDVIKRDMAELVRTRDARVLNGLGPFAAVYDIHFPEYVHPVLVLKNEEPGSKQKLAMEYGYTESICHDMINHLINDIAVMGARPLAVLDTIVCGRAERDTIRTLVRGMADACRENFCSLVGGETSIQPQVVEDGVYVLSASVAGIAEREQIIDGSAVREGDALICLASNGLHTNGYSLVRLLLERKPQLKLARVGRETFLEAVMRPHTPYYPALRDVLPGGGVTAMAHITGGGIEGNLSRVIPDGLTAHIDLSQLEIPQVFSRIRAEGAVPDGEMLSTFNCGAGLIMAVRSDAAARILEQLSPVHRCYRIGDVRVGAQKIAFSGNVQWER